MIIIATADRGLKFEVDGRKTMRTLGTLCIERYLFFVLSLYHSSNGGISFLCLKNLYW
jgi:hypothetical protein